MYRQARQKCKCVSFRGRGLKDVRNGKVHDRDSAIPAHSSCGRVKRTRPVGISHRDWDLFIAKDIIHGLDKKRPKKEKGER